MAPPVKKTPLDGSSWKLGCFASGEYILVQALFQWYDYTRVDRTHSLDYCYSSCSCCVKAHQNAVAHTHCFVSSHSTLQTEC